MGRGERRAKEREEAQRERTAKSLAAVQNRKPVSQVQGDILETQDETARRIYRAGAKPERRSKPKRRGTEKPRKWREGRL